jgi:hypothetical protein
MANKNTIHGFKPKSGAHPFYQTWTHILDRCLNPKSADWENYGGRGITLCRKWRRFLGFHKDMFSTWKPGLTLERTNNGKGYSKSNCKWADRIVQNRNKRNNKLIIFSGQKLIGSVWSEKLGGNPELVNVRIRRGWSIASAVTVPVLRR